jgi:hypothetical protein
VWAIDHSQASFPIDGRYPYLFAVRDLASHYQLAWYPVMTQRAEEVVPILQNLFAEHGRPLVIKSDNDPAFVAEVTQAMLQAQQLGQLFSPADRSRWNRLPISCTLEQLGYVTKRRVRRGPPRAKRPRRNQIERKASAAGIALAPTAEADLPAT